MCYSATASFVAGASLTAIGVVTIASTKHRSELPFAAIPLLFGFQQLVEGVIWLTLRNEAPALKLAMTYVYSAFSHVLWPIYIPLAIYCLESTPWRKRAMLAFAVVGLAVGAYLMYFLIVGPVVAAAVSQHIVYESPHFYIGPVMVAYVVATCFSELVSSHTFVRLFGLLAFVSFVAAYFVYTRALVSIWCFFAALLSVLILVHLKYRGLGGFPSAESSPQANVFRSV